VNSIQQRATAYLRKALNSPQADFRDGQWASIQALVENRTRLLVVQRTGWGKSMVYFLATRLLRDQGRGLTLLISPLLALIRNQIEATERIGLRAVSINSTNVDDWPTLEAEILANKVDLLLISPERLANDQFRQHVLTRIAQRVGLFVVDEAHCISDWGHDFRPDYRRIVRILQAMPPNIPVLATTATANNRVVSDVVDQIGKGLQVVWGPLGRASLLLQTLDLPNRSQRLPWLAHTIPQLPGSGIVYTRTKRDADRVAEWLVHKGIRADAYHADRGVEDRIELEEKLQHNRLKAIVATSALGMGYDKPDLGFVIHFQRPGSVVEYYQQVGRAGRGQNTPPKKGVPSPPGGMGGSRVPG